MITRTTGGLYSPLLPMEQAVVDIVIQMARIRVCLRPSDGIRLVNSMLKESNLQDKLIEWKNKYSHSEGNMGGVGASMWSAVWSAL